MSSLDKLLGKKEEKKPTPNALVEQKEKPKSSGGFSLNLGAKKDAAIPKETKQEIPTNGIMDSSNTDDNPFASLGDALSGINSSDPFAESMDKICDEGVKSHANGDVQFQNPTLTDVEKFVFEEQPDQSTEEITEMFSTMIDDLSLATGDQVPTNVARCLKFIKEHSFLADILRPEAIGILVTGLRRSYGFIVKAKTEKGVKKKKRDQEVSQVLDSLSDLSF